MLMQYDSDSQSSGGTHTESDDSGSGHSTSPVNLSLSPVVVETTDPSRNLSSGASPVGNETSGSGVHMNGAGAALKSSEPVTHKKRPCDGKSPLEKKKGKTVAGSERTVGNRPSPFVNLHDTVVSMQQLQAVAPVMSMPANYQPFPSGYANYPPPGQHGCVMPRFSLQPSSLGLTSGARTHVQYTANRPRGYPAESKTGPPRYHASPRGYFPQWRTSFAPMPCQGPPFKFSNNGNNGNNVFR